MSEQADIAAFEQWCGAKGVKPFPAVPAILAKFVTDHASAGAARISEAVVNIAAFDVTRGAANAAATPVVSAAICEVAGTIRVPPPGSWPKKLWPIFETLPYVLQHHIAARDKQARDEIRRAHNQMDALRKKVA
jgi:hypothetical protein